MSLELEREDAVQRLCAAYARDQLTTGELEARLERVYASADRQALDRVLEGLPPAQIPRLGEAPVRVPNLAPPGAATSGSGPAQPRRSGERPTGRGPGERRYVALMSEVRKEGAWTPTPVIVANAFMGNVVLDFRETAIPAEGVDIYTDVIMGELTVILPPGLPADVDCTSFMGAVKDKSKAGVAGAPTIRITGGAVMGGITVVTKVPQREGERTLRGQMRTWLGSGE